MAKTISATKRAYLAGLLDGDGSIYVRLKPNSDYKYGFQISPHVVFFQSAKEAASFKKVSKILNYGYVRKRKDGILEHNISKKKEIVEFLNLVKPYLILKRRQAELMLEILEKKERVKNEKDVLRLANLIERFRKLNYSKKRKKHNLSP